MANSPALPQACIDAILANFPELRNARLTVLDAGMDSLAVDADDRVIFKFPRHLRAEAALRREAAFLSYLLPHLSIAVPRLTLFEAPLVFSAHEKLRGDHLVTAQYLELPELARDRMADALGLFYAQLHALPSEELRTRGAQPIAPWLTPELIRARAVSTMMGEEASTAEALLAAWEQLPPDPHGTVYGHFDGHGWNIAFDRAAETLTGIYDFADSGFGDLTQEFIYSDLVSPDLTDRIVARYTRHSGRQIDLDRVRLLASIHRLTELADAIGDPQAEPLMRTAWQAWLGR